MNKVLGPCFKTPRPFEAIQRDIKFYETHKETIITCTKRVVPLLYYFSAMGSFYFLQKLKMKDLTVICITSVAYTLIATYVGLKSLAIPKQVESWVDNHILSLKNRAKDFSHLDR